MVLESLESVLNFLRRRNHHMMMSHQDGSDNGNLSPTRDDCCKGLFMSSFDPHHQSYSPRDRYKFHGNFSNVANFDYLRDMYP